MLNSAVLNNPDTVSEKMTEPLLIFFSQMLYTNFFPCPGTDNFFLFAKLIVDEDEDAHQFKNWSGLGGRKNLVHNECSDGDRFWNKQRKMGQFHPYESLWNRILCFFGHFHSMPIN